MRETFGTLIQTSKDFCVDPKTSSKAGLTSTEAFIKREINRAVQFTHKKMQKVFKTKYLPKTASTEADEQYYAYPPGLNVIDTVTIDNDTTIPPLRIIQNQKEWDLINSGPTTSGIPSHIYMRARDYGLYPIPGDAYTLTLVGRFHPRAMSADDYVTGTATITQNSQALTGTDTVWTNKMIGRYFSEADSNSDVIGEYYRIGAFTSTTALTLENYFEDTALSGSNYVIAESPDLPEEIHEFIPYRVASVYYGTKRRDSKKAQEYLNFYYTGDWYNTRRKGQIEGGLLGFIQSYALDGSDNTQLINLNEPVRHHYLAEEWEEVTT
ncbi:MAG: hypothetical protein GY861_03220 [bacterium]|nr:hypothetical protein [bacterium]